MTKPYNIFIEGIPGSGKSTLLETCPGTLQTTAYIVRATSPLSSWPGALI